ncbi:MAG: hypothetical protein KDC14_01380, partial [Planctomycetes bacterium]|nr:hypothetical protein [Planctomycetota bacterium]
MRGGSKWLIVALLALNVAAWGYELLGPEGGGRPVVLAREVGTQDADSGLNPGFLAPRRTCDDLTLELAGAPAGRDTDARESAVRQAPAQYWVWVLDLAADHERYNASRAFDALTRCDDRVVPLLQEALESPDRQQRQLAGSLLRIRGSEATAALLDVTLEALRIDHEWHGGHRTCQHAQNSGHAASFLVRHASKVADRLIENLDSKDPQEGFLSAYVLGRGGVAQSVDRTCAVLVEHLGDNHVRGDAQMGADALHALGALAVPYLVYAETRAD